MEVLAGPTNVDLQVHVAAQADRQRGLVALQEAGVGDDHEVAGESRRGWPASQASKFAEPDFLLALDDVADVDGQPAARLQPGSDRPQVEVDLALVVGHASTEDAAVLDAGLEGRAGPLVERVGGLDVVVGVDDDRGSVCGMQPVGVDDRVAPRLGDLDVLEADGPHPRREPLRAGPHVLVDAH